MSKTAVDILIEQMTDFLRVGLTDSGWEMFDKIVNEAKEKEKQQIMDAWEYGDYCVDLPNGEWEQKYKSAEDYYNQTYNQ